MQELIQKIANKCTKQSKVANTYSLPDIQDYFALGQVSVHKCTFFMKAKHTIKKFITLQSYGTLVRDISELRWKIKDKYPVGVVITEYSITRNISKFNTTNLKHLHFTGFI